MQGTRLSRKGRMRRSLCEGKPPMKTPYPRSTWRTARLPHGFLGARQPCTAGPKEGAWCCLQDTNLYVRELYLARPSPIPSQPPCHTSQYDPCVKGQHDSTSLGPYVVQLWARTPQVSTGPKPSNSAVWSDWFVSVPRRAYLQGTCEGRGDGEGVRALRGHVVGHGVGPVREVRHVCSGRDRAVYRQTDDERLVS